MELRIHVPPASVEELKVALEHAKRLDRMDPDAGVLSPARTALHCLLGNAEAILRTLDAGELRHLFRVLGAIVAREPVASRKGFETVYVFLDQLAVDVGYAIEPFAMAEAIAHQDVDELPDIDLSDPDAGPEAEG